MKTILSQIPTYRSFYLSKGILEIGYPWLAFGAILALERILGGEKERNTFKILELGSGGSTIFFSRRSKSVLSLEHDLKWYKTMKKLKLPNVVLKQGSIEELVEIIKKENDGSYDIVLVDSGYSYEARIMLMNASINKVKKYGWLILDNYLFCDRFFNPIGWDIYTFDMFQYSGRGTKLCKKLW